MGLPLESNLDVHSTKLGMPDDPLTMRKQPLWVFPSRSTLFSMAQTYGGCFLTGRGLLGILSLVLWMTRSLLGDRPMEAHVGPRRSPY